VTTIDQLDEGGKTALYHACATNHKGCVKVLLEYNANPNERCSDDQTPVFAAVKTGNTKIMRLLIQCGGDLRLHDKNGKMPKDCLEEIESSILRKRMIAFIEETRYLNKNRQSQMNSHLQIGSSIRG
jgi:ankyrin repeat protein